MFARKLGRTARLVLVLAVVFGGVGLAAGVADRGNDAVKSDGAQSTQAAQSTSAVQYSTLIWDWE
ncbi:hypothetical protein ACIA5D_10480 [Actinoplanes sp. NPDC051513]|uniref:hypothetical protein n=1 Tax=Actinoplanes sp. NPDC051513 TaxID=3363908 RepID=UPI0037962AB2